MSDYTPTTEQVRDLYILADPAGYKSRREYADEFDRWLERTFQEARAEAWGEGFADGVNHDLGDWENAPSNINNPHRQEEK